METKKTLKDLIFEEANKKKFLKANKIHHNICVRLKEMSESYDFPIGVLVYIAVGKSAHKKKVFEKGYTEIEEDKAKKVIEFCEIVSKKLGEDFRTNDRIVHAIDRYVLYGGSKSLLNKRLKEVTEVDLKSVKTAKEFCKILFKDCDRIEFTEKGYISSIHRK